MPYSFILAVTFALAAGELLTTGADSDPVLLRTPAASTGTKNSVPSEAHTATIEFHFGEGFSGEQVVIRRADQTLATVTLKTRMQIGLADIKELSLTDGDEITLEVLGDSIRKTLHIDAARPYVAVHLVDKSLNVTLLDRSPGYL